VFVAILEVANVNHISFKVTFMKSMCNMQQCKLFYAPRSNACISDYF